MPDFLGMSQCLFYWTSLRCFPKVLRRFWWSSAMTIHHHCYWCRSRSRPCGKWNQPGYNIEQIFDLVPEQSFHIYFFLIFYKYVFLSMLSCGWRGVHWYLTSTHSEGEIRDTERWQCFAAWRYRTAFVKCCYALALSNVLVTFKKPLILFPTVRVWHCNVGLTVQNGCYLCFRAVKKAQPCF